MSFDAKYNFTRFKISFRSGFSGSLQILYSLLYASALIYIPPTTPTCSRISNCSAVATANEIYTLLIATLSLAGVPCLASSLSSAYTPGWCLRISSGEGRCEKLGVKRGRGSYFCSIICFFIFISRPAALARRAGVKRGLAGCEKARTMDGTLNSSLNQVFHLGAVLKAMTNQNWEIEC